MADAGFSCQLACSDLAKWGYPQVYMILAIELLLLPLMRPRTEERSVVRWVAMSEPPKIRILPDQEQGRGEELGRVLEFEVDGNDTAIRAHVEWTELASFRNSRTRSRTAWLPVDQVAPIPGEVYTGVARTPAAGEGDAAGLPSEGAPADWPPGVPAPSVKGWEKAVQAWLFDQLPPDFRGYAVLAEEPTALVWMARLHLRHAYTATVRGYRSAAVELRKELPPHALAEVDEVYRVERERIIRCGRAVDAIERAYS